jgi:hypothetical protein
MWQLLEACFQWVRVQNVAHLTCQLTPPHRARNAPDLLDRILWPISRVAWTASDGRSNLSPISQIIASDFYGACWRTLLDWRWLRCQSCANYQTFASAPVQMRLDRQDRTLTSGLMSLKTIICDFMTVISMKKMRKSL